MLTFVPYLISYIKQIWGVKGLGKMLPRTKGVLFMMLEILPFPLFVV